MLRTPKQELGRSALLRTLTAAVVWGAAAMGGVARADVIFSNFDENTEWAGYWFILNNQPAVEYERAVQFDSTVTFFLDALELPVLTPGEHNLYLPPVPPGTEFGDSMRVAIYADDNGTPGQLLETVEAPDSLPLCADEFCNPPPAPVLVEFAGTTLLEKGQTYWIGVGEAEATVLGWVAGVSIPELSSRIRIVDGMTWGPVQPRRLGLRVYGTPAPQCEADITGDEVVDIDDLLAVISAWGACASTCPPACVGDIVPTCAVDIDDLLAVIGAWGACP